MRTTKRQTASKQQILDELHELEPTQWQEVLDFIGYLRYRRVERREQERHPDLSPEELAWRVTRRMQGDPRLGR